MTQKRLDDDLIDFIRPKVLKMDEDVLAVFATETRREMRRRQHEFKIAKVMFLDQFPEENGNRLRCTWDCATQSVTVRGKRHIRTNITFIETATYEHNLRKKKAPRLSLVPRGAA